MIRGNGFVDLEDCEAGQLPQDVPRPKQGPADHAELARHCVNDSRAEVEGKVEAELELETLLEIAE